MQYDVGIVKRRRIIAPAESYFSQQAAGGGGSASKTNLTAWYQLGEASGNRVDSHTNALDLDFVSGSDGNATGKAGGNGYLNSNAGSHLAHQSATYNFAGDWTIAMWVWLPASLSAENYMAAKFVYGTTPLEFIFTVDASARFQFRIYNSSSSNVGDLLTGVKTLSAWYFCALKYTPGGPITLDLNDSGSPQSQTTSGNITSGDKYFSLGTSGSTGNGIIMDQVGIWTRLLTAGELTFLYNTGTGRNYSDLT